MGAVSVWEGSGALQPPRCSVPGMRLGFSSGLSGDLCRGHETPPAYRRVPWLCSQCAGTGSPAGARLGLPA